MTVVRDATAADAGGCAAAYAPYVLGSPATFETVPPDAAEMARRIAAAQERHAWLVAVEDTDDIAPVAAGGATGGGRVVGYAYGGPWKPRAAYAWTCEVSVYLAPGRGGAGTGRALYGQLLARLAGRGFRTAVAGMTLPNPASEALHRSLGFAPVGTFVRTGWKLGAWHDVGYVQLALGSDGPPAGPTT